MTFLEDNIKIREDGTMVQVDFEAFCDLLKGAYTSDDIEWFCKRFDLEGVMYIRMDNAYRSKDGESGIKSWDIKAQHPGYCILKTHNNGACPTAIIAKHNPKKKFPIFAKCDQIYNFDSKVFLDLSLQGSLLLFLDEYNFIAFNPYKSYRKFKSDISLFSRSSDEVGTSKAFEILAKPEDTQLEYLIEAAISEASLLSKNLTNAMSELNPYLSKLMNGESQ